MAQSALIIDDINVHGVDETTKNPKSLSPPTTSNTVGPNQSGTTLATSQLQVDTLPDQIYVTRKDRLGIRPAWIDCDFCEHRTKTRVTRDKIPAGHEGVLACLLCLVCPCLICLAFSDDDGEKVSHYCTGSDCGKQVTEKLGDSPIQVFKPQPPAQEVTKYGPAAAQEAEETGPPSMKYEQQT